MSYYKICRNYGAHLDPGEICECQREDKEKAAQCCEHWTASAERAYNTISTPIVTAEGRGCQEISPEILSSIPAGQTPASLEAVEEAMRASGHIIIHLLGACLEGAGVQDGGFVAVDFTRRPSPPRYKNRGGDGSQDICLCYARFPGSSAPSVMCKVYEGRWGPWQIVGTRHKTGSQKPNVGMTAEKIFGVVFAAWDRDGRLLWQRDPDEFPDQLGAQQTICGDAEPWVK